MSHFFTISIFINMNRLFAFIVGSIALIVAGLYSVYEIIKGVLHGSESQN